MAGYRQIYRVGTIQASECIDCGALVISTETHDAWHAKLDKALADLSRASDPRSRTPDPHDAGVVNYIPWSHR